MGGPSNHRFITSRICDALIEEMLSCWLNVGGDGGGGGSGGGRLSYNCSQMVARTENQRARATEAVCMSFCLCVCLGAFPGGFLYGTVWDLFLLL